MPLLARLIDIDVPHAVRTSPRSAPTSATVGQASSGVCKGPEFRRCLPTRRPSDRPKLRYSLHLRGSTSVWFLSFSPPIVLVIVRPRGCRVQESIANCSHNGLGAVLCVPRQRFVWLVEVVYPEDEKKQIGMHLVNGCQD